MRAILCCFLVSFLPIVSGGPFQPHHGFAVSNQGTVQNPKSLPITQSPDEGIKKRVELVQESGKIGSSPPSCEHKCYGCMPCEAIQVPPAAIRAAAQPQYTNYEPEGWKCKCGPAFFSP